MISRIRQIVTGTDTRAGRLFDWAILSLIVYSIITLSIETLPGISAEVSRFLEYSEIVVTLLFTAEYLLRVVIAERKTRYIFSFYGLIDLLAILPFYLALGVDMRGIRILRLFRILRIFKLARYNRAIRRFARAFRLSKEEIWLFCFATGMILFLAAVGIYYFENPAQPENFPSIPHSLWWAVTTLTTVGYGDIYPITAGGKFFTFVVLMIGLGIVAVPAGLIASALSQVRREDHFSGSADTGDNTQNPATSTSDKSAQKPESDR